MNLKKEQIMERMEYETMWSDEIRITNESKSILNSIAKWTKFLSILGFIFLGLSAALIICAGLLITFTNGYMASSSAYPYHPGVFQLPYAIAYLVIIFIYFIPIYFLYKFSSNTKKALQDNDSEELTKAFTFLKKHYLFIGIFAIVMLAIYLIGFLMIIFGLLMNSI